MKITLEPQLEAQLKAIAKQSNKTEQEVIIEAITKHIQELNQSQNCYDLALHLGVIGRAENLPSDLSTNPNYLEGFCRLLCIYRQN